MQFNVKKYSVEYIMNKTYSVKVKFNNLTCIELLKVRFTYIMNKKTWDTENIQMQYTVK